MWIYFTGLILDAANAKPVVLGEEAVQLDDATVANKNHVGCDRSRVLCRTPEGRDCSETLEGPIGEAAAHQQRRKSTRVCACTNTRSLTNLFQRISITYS